MCTHVHEPCNPLTHILDDRFYLCCVLRMNSSSSSWSSSTSSRRSSCSTAGFSLSLSLFFYRKRWRCEHTTKLLLSLSPPDNTVYYSHFRLRRTSKTSWVRPNSILRCYSMLLINLKCGHFLAFFFLKKGFLSIGCTYIFEKKKKQLKKNASEDVHVRT